MYQHNQPYKVLPILSKMLLLIRISHTEYCLFCGFSLFSCTVAIHIWLRKRFMYSSILRFSSFWGSAAIHIWVCKHFVYSFTLSKVALLHRFAILCIAQETENALMQPVLLYFVQHGRLNSFQIAFPCYTLYSTESQKHPCASCFAILCIERQTETVSNYLAVLYIARQHKD